MTQLPDASVDQLFEAGGARGNRLRKWMEQNHTQLACKFADHRDPDWNALARGFAKLGITGRGGQACTSDGIRMCWKSVRQAAGLPHITTAMRPALADVTRPTIAANSPATATDQMIRQVLDRLALAGEVPSLKSIPTPPVSLPSAAPITEVKSAVVFRSPPPRPGRVMPPTRSPQPNQDPQQWRVDVRRQREAAAAATSLPAPLLSNRLPSDLPVELVSTAATSPAMVKGRWLSKLLK